MESCFQSYLVIPLVQSLSQIVTYSFRCQLVPLWDKFPCFHRNMVIKMLVINTNERIHSHINQNFTYECYTISHRDRLTFTNHNFIATETDWISCTIVAIDYYKRHTNTLTSYLQNNSNTLPQLFYLIMLRCVLVLQIP